MSLQLESLFTKLELLKRIKMGNERRELFRPRADQLPPYRSKGVVMVQTWKMTTVQKADRIPFPEDPPLTANEHDDNKQHLNTLQVHQNILKFNSKVRWFVGGRGRFQHTCRGGRGGRQVQKGAESSLNKLEVWGGGGRRGSVRGFERSVGGGARAVGGSARAVGGSARRVSRYREGGNLWMEAKKEQ